MIYLLPFLPMASDLLAGCVALGKHAERIERRYVIAFAAGVLLSVTFFDVLPEAEVAVNAAFLALGFVTFYVLEKAMMIHACGESECETHQIGPIAVFGMALDNVVDGAGIVSGYLIDPFLGLAITVAVVLHEIPQGMTSALIMREAKWSRAGIWRGLALIGLLYPVGGFLAGLIAPEFRHAVLAFIAGDFLYLAAGDLLPDAHRRFNWKVILSVLLGMIFMLALTRLVPAV
jgi:zinc transporter ZupT